MDKYTLYVKEHVREAFFKDGATKAQAMAFLASGKGVVKDSLGNKYKTVKELKNAKSVRPKSGAEFDSLPGVSESVFESTDRKLSGSSGDNSE